MAHSPSMPTNHTRLIGSAAWLPLGLLITIVVLIGSLILSIGLGAADIDVETVLAALFCFDENNFNQLVIRTVRLPRVLAGVTIGAGLAVAGAIMQGLTTNPLADPGLLGIEAGAAFAVVLGVFLIGNPPLMVYALLAMIGATLAAFIVYGLSSLGRDGATPLKLTLAGAIFTAFTTSLTSAILILDQNTLEQIRLWTVGSLAGREMPLLVNTAPIILLGVVGAWMLSRQITTISLGEDIARSLGQNTTKVKGVAALLVILMAGGAVALAGPVGFVGLVIPHVVRAMVGVDYRWIIPYSALFGGLLVTLADTVGRVALRPLEIPIGIMLAFVGAPFFIYLARWKVRR